MQNANSLFLGGNTINTPTYKEQAYGLIKDAILFRRFQVGTIYSQDGICTELGISRTPVREALLELQNEGYISIHRGRGIEVVPLSLQQAMEIVEARYYIELAGSELAAQRAQAGHLEKMEANIKEMAYHYSTSDTTDTTYMYRMDRQFHRTMFDAADNSWLSEIIENLRDHFLRVETQNAFSSTEGCTQVVQEHRRIFEAIKAGDREKAKACMDSHLTNTYERTIKPSLAALDGQSRD